MPIENASRLQFDYNLSQIFTSNMTINDQNKENNAVAAVNNADKSNEQQPKSISSEYESIPNIENKDCEYLKLVMSFKRTLVLPDVFFSYDIPVCYCVLCLSNCDRNSLEGKTFNHFQMFFFSIF